MSAFDDLREPTDPIDPDPAFAARLRRRLAEALDPTRVDVPVVDLPERTPTMTTTTTPTTTATTATAASDTTTDTAPARPAAAIVPYLAVAGAAEAIDWYVHVLGAVETVRYTSEEDGRVGHAELDIGGAELMLADEHPEIGVLGPRSLGGTSVTLHVAVDDVDAVWARALDRGADGQRPPEDQPYGDRACTFVDPFGHRWVVATPTARLTTEQIQAAMPDYRVTEP